MVLLSSSYLELPFFVNLLLLLVLTRVMGEVFERIKQPAMIGEILAGIILGPTLFNIVQRTDSINIIAELGVFLLVIIAGLEINIDEIIKSLKGKSIVISLCAFFIPMFSGLLIGLFFGQDIMTTIFIGLCIAITALPVIIRILMDMNKMNSEVGQKIISIAIFDDVLSLAFLGLIINAKGTDLSIISIVKVAGVSLIKLSLFIGILAFSYFLLKKISKRKNYLEIKLNSFINLLKSKESLYALIFVFILFFASITESLGFHFIIGAFFASLLLNENILGKENFDSFHNTTNSLAMGFLSPIFFAGIGLEFNISSIQNYWLLTVIILVSCLSKVIGGFVGGRIAGLNNKTSLTIGIGINARGIMELVIANIAYKAGLINLEIFSMLVIMGMVTTIITPLMLKRSFIYLEKK